MIAWLAYLTVAVVWGSTYFGIALGLESFTPYGMVAARFSVAAVLALGLGRLRGEAWPPLRECGHLVLVGALLLGGSNALVSWAELHLSTGLVAILAALVPLWLAVFSMAREPLGPMGWCGILLGIGGVVVLVCGPAATCVSTRVGSRPWWRRRSSGPGAPSMASTTSMPAG